MNFGVDMSGSRQPTSNAFHLHSINRALKCLNYLDLKVSPRFAKKPVFVAVRGKKNEESLIRILHT